MGLPFFGADSRLDSDILTVSPAAASGFLEANLTDDQLFELFKHSATGTLDIITDAGVGNTGDVDYLGLVNHDLFTQGSTITFASSPDNVVYSTIFTVAPADNKIIARSFTLVTDRFFRLRITGSAAAPFIGQASWGKRVEVPFGIEVGYDPQTETVRMRHTRSQTGQILGAVATHSERRSNISLKFMPESFVRGTSVGDFGEFWDNNAKIGKLFLWQWNGGNPGSFEKDAVFMVIENDASIGRPLVTQLDVGFRDISFSAVGLGE